MIGISVGNPCHHLINQVVISTAGVPGLKIVPVQPNDVREALVTVSEELPIVVGFCWPAISESGEPSACFHRSKKDCEAILGRKSDHLVGALEVSVIRRGEIARRGERRDAIKGCTVAVAARVGIAEKIDPKGIKSA